jgi:hypothetical protein
MELAMLELEALLLLPFMWWARQLMAHNEFMNDLYADMAR